MKNHSTKNHRGEENNCTESQGGRLYAVANNPVFHVLSLDKYLLVLNPDCDIFWQRPETVEKKMEYIWFDNAAVGKNTLGDKMKIPSQKYNLSAVYTNHILRTTTITMLDIEGFEARHITAISGYKY